MRKKVRKFPGRGIIRGLTEHVASAVALYGIKKILHRLILASAVGGGLMATPEVAKMVDVKCTFCCRVTVECGV